MTEKKIKANTKDSSIPTAKDSVQSLALRYGVDALMDNNKPDSSFSQRAKVRQQLNLTQQQKNLEQILASVEKLCGDETGSDVDPDWTHAYLALASRSQSRSMQQLWAQILSREVASPGSFSVRALHTLTQMTQREAQWFQRACQLSSRIGGDGNNKLLTGVIKPAGNLGLRRSRVAKLSLSQYRLSYNHMMQLSELGLIYDRELETTPSPTHDLLINYADSRWRLRPKGKNIRLFYHRMTPIGDELAQLIPLSPIETYQQELLNQLGIFFDIQGG